MESFENFIVDNFESAIKSGHIKAYYQPVFRALTQNVSCAEALARWEDPERGIISPAEFVPILERHNLIHKLDAHILRCICNTYHVLKESGCPIPPFSINLSRLDFADTKLFDGFVRILEENEIPVSAIRIEITESLMINDSEDFRKNLDKFRDSGFRIWMDDFGSGYSSLNVLKEYSFDLLKIDLIFLRNFGEESMQMLSAVINLAKALKLHVLAEGIESDEQFNFLLDSGCELIQGFYLARPMTARDYIEYITSSPDLVETQDEVTYWDNVGQINFLSPNPLESFVYKAEGEPSETQDNNEFIHSKIPIALLEYKDGKTHCVYHNREYYKRIQKLGYTCVDEIEESFNRRDQVQHNNMVNILNQSIRDNSVKKIDYVENGTLFTIRTKCLAKHGDTYMMAITLRTSSADKEERLPDDIAKLGEALFLTYNLITFIYPSINSSERIYNASIITTDYSKLPLDEGVQKFASTELHPDDRARYLEFMDLSTLDSRVAEVKLSFIQEPFRIRSKKEDEYVWQMVRLTKLPNSNPAGYLYTLQELADKAVRGINHLTENNPEFI